VQQLELKFAKLNLREFGTEFEFLKEIHLLLNGARRFNSKQKDSLFDIAYSKLPTYIQARFCDMYNRSRKSIIHLNSLISRLISFDVKKKQREFFTRLEKTFNNFGPPLEHCIDPQRLKKLLLLITDLVDDPEMAPFYDVY